MIAARVNDGVRWSGSTAADRRRTALTRKGKLSVLGALVACLVVAGLAGAAQQTHASSSAAGSDGVPARRQGQDQARHLPAVRQRPLPAGQPERPVGPRADAAPAELPQGQRHARHERPHRSDLPHGRRDPQLADGPLPGPARPGRLELVRLLQAGRLGRVLVELQVLDRPDRRRQPGERSRRRRRRTRTTTWSTTTRRRSAAPARCATRPAPWVPYTRAGCDVGNVGVANTVLENNNAIVFRSRPDRLSRRAQPWARRTSRSRTASRVRGRRDDHARRRSEPRAGRRSPRRPAPAGAPAPASPSPPPLTKAHAPAASPVYGPTATDPTGDMTKVFGEGSHRVERGHATRSSRTPAPPLARQGADRLRRDRDPLRLRAAAICNSNANATRSPTSSRTRPAATDRLQGALRREVRQPGDQPRLGVRQRHGRQPIVDPFNQCGFPGFDGMFAKNTLGEVAQMQEAGVPVTFAYISDAHDFHGVAGNTHPRTARARPATSSSSRTTTRRSATSSPACKNDGITKDNTLFVVTVEEGDHFAGTAARRPGLRRRHHGVHLRQRPRHRGQRRPEAARRHLQREPRHVRDDELQRPLRHGAERLHHRQSCPRTRRRARTLEKAMSDM